MKRTLLKNKGKRRLIVVLFRVLMEALRWYMSKLQVVVLCRF